MMQQFSVHCNH